MIKVYIDNEEVVFSQELEINEEMLATSTVILDSCYPKSWEEDRDYISRLYFPKDYSKCEFYDDEELIFSGVVKNSGNISLNPREPKFCKLQILDYKTFLSEGTTLDFVIADKTISEAIETVVNTIKSYGFVLGTIFLQNADEIIGAYSTLDKTPYDVFQYFAEISNSRWFTRRINDTQIAIDFYDSSSLPVAEEIKYNTEYFKAKQITDMSFSFSTADYRNKQVIISNEVYGNVEQNELLLANGYDASFITEQKIGTIISIKVDGVKKTFATTDEKNSGVIADFYYKTSENSFESENILSAGSEVEISYTPIIQGREVVYNNQEINRIKEQLGINGTISRYETRNDVLYSSQLNQIAQNYIKYKGNAEITLKIETLNANLFKVGQQVYFDAPINELKGDYLIKNKTSHFYVANDLINVFYTFDLSNNFNAENAINYFDNQRAKANGNISQGEYIARNIDIESEASIIFDGYTLTEVAVNNTLDAELDVVL